jgi:argininosuccinate lyase
MLLNRKVRANARLQRLQPRFGDRRGQRLGAKSEIAEQRAEDEQREHEVASQRIRRLRQIAREQHLDADADDDRQRADQQRAGHVGLPSEPRSNRIEDRELGDQMRLDHRHHFQPLRCPQPGDRLAHQRRDGGKRVHGEHDAQDRAEVTKVRQFESDGDLPYNRCISSPACKHRAGGAGSIPARAHHRVLSATVDCEASRNAREGRIPAPAIDSCRDFRTAPLQSAGIRSALSWLNPSDRTTPPPADGPGASASPCPIASSATRHPSISIAAWRSRYRRLLAHARMLGAVGVLAATTSKPLSGDADDPRRDRARRISWSRDLETFTSTSKRLTAPPATPQAPAHRALAQRSGRDRPRFWLRAEIDALMPARRVAPGIYRLAERHADTIMPGYASAGRATGYVRPPSARVRGDVRARRRTLPRLPASRQPAALEARRCGDDLPIDRTRSRRAGSGALRNSLTRFPIAISRSSSLPSPHDDDARVASPRAWWMDRASRSCRSPTGLPDRRCARKNPDVAELARGKTGRVTGHLVALLMLMKGQPLAYNRDNQEDKEPLFDTVDTLADTLAIIADLVATGITVDAARMRAAAAEGHATATDLADYLVRKGMPFRDAHEAVARAVRRADERGSELADLPLAELQAFAGAIGDDVFAALTLEGSVAARNHPGGTAPAQVRAASIAARARLDAETQAIAAGTRSPSDSPTSTKSQPR